MRLSKTTFWNRINTGFSDPAVATVLTACGIETGCNSHLMVARLTRLQQYLPLAVLKRERLHLLPSLLIRGLQQYLPLAVLKPLPCAFFSFSTTTTLQQYLPLAVLKLRNIFEVFIFYLKLQQYLPLAVLKHAVIIFNDIGCYTLQQYLPLAVLKLMNFPNIPYKISPSCNSTYRLRY